MPVTCCEQSERRVSVMCVLMTAPEVLSLCELYRYDLCLHVGHAASAIWHALCYYGLSCK